MTTESRRYRDSAQAIVLLMQYHGWDHTKTKGKRGIKIVSDDGESNIVPESNACHQIPRPADHTKVRS